MTDERKLSSEMEALLMRLVGDNVGDGCTCPSCDDNRIEMREAIFREMADAADNGEEAYEL